MERYQRVERFRAVYDESYPKIMAYALRRARSREDALDAVAETFVVVWRRLEDVPEDERRLPWVYAVARRVLANQYRSIDRVDKLKTRLMDNRPQRADQSFDLVHDALDRLRSSDRELLTMAAWDDLDNSEIAIAIGTSEANVAVRLHRARKRLAKELTKLGWTEDREIPKRVKSEDTSRTPEEVNGTFQEPGAAEEP